MKKVLFLFFFLISCSASTSSSTELEPNSEEESVIVTNTTLSTNDTHDDHDHHDEESHDDHEEEAHDDHDEETPKPIDLLPFDYHLIVPDGVPDKLEVLNYNLGEETVIHFEVRDVEKEIHVHGYDIHFMVYPNQDNILKIELTIAGEFEIEDHDSGYEFARLIVSP